MIANRSGYWQRRVCGEVKEDQKNKEDEKEEASGKNERRGI